MKRKAVLGGDGRNAPGRTRKRARPDDPAEPEREGLLEIREV